MKDKEDLPWSTPDTVQEEIIDVPMYWVFPAGVNMPGKPKIFGKETYRTDEGYLVVAVPSNLVENELGRKGRRLVTEEEYQIHLEEQNV